MDKEAVAQKIIQLSEDENGLFVQLGSSAIFNEELHTQLLNLLSEYAMLLGDDTMINRSVARYLSDYTGLLEGSIHQLRRNEPLVAKLTGAHADIIEVTFKLLP